MPDPSPIDILNATLSDLRSGDPDAAPAAKPDVKPDATAELLALNQTPEGRAKVASMFGIVNEEASGDTIIDVPNRAELDHLTGLLGGAEALPAATAAFKEAMGILGVGPDDYDELVENMTPEEENAEIADTIKEWNEILADPVKAQMRIDSLWRHPDREPMKSYILGRAPQAVNDAIAKLHQAAAGEKPVGRPRPKTDGQIY